MSSRRNSAGKTSRSESSYALEIFGAPWKLAFVAGGVSAVLLLLWSITAKIPIRVQGLGVLFPVGSASRFTTSSYGKVHLLFGEWEKVNNTWFDSVAESIDRIKFLDGDDTKRLAEILTQNLNEETLSKRSGEVRRYQSIGYPYKVKGPAVLLYADAPEEKSELLNALGAFIATEDAFNKISERQVLLKTRLDRQKQQRGKLQQELVELSEIGFISKPDMLANLGVIDSLESQIAELDIEKRKLESQSKQALSVLKMSLSSFTTKTLVYSGEDTFVQQVSIGSGEYSPPNIPVILYSKNIDPYPSRMPVFFSARSVNQINNGNTGFATPLGWPRSQVGGIKLKVSDTSQLANVPEQVESRLGLTGFSKSIAMNFISPTMVIVDLERNKDPEIASPYKWTIKPTMSKYPEVRLGDEFDVELETRTEVPISFVLPFFNKLIGRTPPEIRLIKNRKGDKE